MGGKINPNLRPLGEQRSAMELHREYESKASSIIEFAKAFGEEAALRRFNIRNVETLHRIIKRHGESPAPVSIDRFALHETGESLFEQLAKGFIRHISKMEANNLEKDEEIAELQFTIHKLQLERKTWRVKEAERDEAVLLELVRKVQT